MAAMIGRPHHLVLDCPDPAALARFYSELLGQPITYRSQDWVVVAANDTSSGLAFQLAPDHRPPTWPDPAVPQQVHLDVMVEDVAAAGPRVLALGATRLDGQDVYADPAGHPFCLIRRPPWAPPIAAPAWPADWSDRMAGRDCPMCAADPLTPYSYPSRRPPRPAGPLTPHSYPCTGRPENHQSLSFPAAAHDRGQFPVKTMIVASNQQNSAIFCP